MEMETENRVIRLEATYDSVVSSPGSKYTRLDLAMHGGSPYFTYLVIDGETYTLYRQNNGTVYQLHRTHCYSGLRP